jgi:hypothetical protein
LPSYSLILRIQCLGSAGVHSGFSTMRAGKVHSSPVPLHEVNLLFALWSLLCDVPDIITSHVHRGQLDDV